MTEITQLLKEFGRFAYGQSLSSAFTDLLDWTLLPFKMHETLEAQKQALETTAFQIPFLLCIFELLDLALCITYIPYITR